MKAATEGISWIWLDKVFFQTLEFFPQLFKTRSCLTIGTNALYQWFCTLIANMKFSELQINWAFDNNSPLSCNEIDFKSNCPHVMHYSKSMS